MLDLKKINGIVVVGKEGKMKPRDFNTAQLEEQEIILVNKIRCKKCNTEIESKDVHEFKYCKCGAVAVDGGQEYLRRIGNPEDIEDISETTSRKKYILILKEKIRNQEKIIRNLNDKLKQIKEYINESNRDEFDYSITHINLIIGDTNEEEKI